MGGGQQFGGRHVPLRLAGEVHGQIPPITIRLL